MQTAHSHPKLLTESPVNHLRPLSVRIAQCMQRWPRVLLLVASFVYVSVLMLVIFTSNNASKTITNRQISPTPAPPVVILPPGARRLRCIAWRGTGQCRPNGPREPQNDKNCSEIIAPGMSGFCEVVDIDTGEQLQVMRRHCNSVKGNVKFRCADAPAFANYPIEGQAAVEKVLVPGFSLPHVAGGGQPRDGIVMVVYPKLLASAYATIRVLHDVLHCRLPIEIWFHVDEIEEDSMLLTPLQELGKFIGDISFHPIYEPRAKGFLSKVFAIYNSYFDRILFLDADNVPVRDPSYLFTTPEFEASGAVFWPDFWHPRRTLFNLHARSILWELLDSPFVDMMEQESGQLLVDRTRHAAPLELVYFYSFHEPNLIEKLDVVYGDKDLFRLAWMKLKTPFHMIEALPAMAGREINGSFCGMTMVQHDVNGDVLFMHRNQHKLTGERDKKMEKAAFENTVVPPEKALGFPQLDGYPDPVIWTHILSFGKNAYRHLYTIDAYRADPQFPQWQPCYGRRYVAKQRLFELHKFSNYSFAGIETDIRRFAFEAAQLLLAQNVTWGEKFSNTTSG